MHTKTIKRRGIALMDSLISLSIVGVLAGLLLPALQAARESVRELQCQLNLRQLSQGLSLYANNHEDAFPKGGPWLRQIGPYLDEQDSKTLNTNNLAQCPATPGFPNRSGDHAARDYSYPIRLKVFTATAMATRRGAGFVGQRQKVSDGLSKTFLLLEQAGPYGAFAGRPKGHEEGPFSSRVYVGTKLKYRHKYAWSGQGINFTHHELGSTAPFYSGMNVNKNNKTGIYSFHVGAFAAMCDTSVRKLSSRTSARVNAALFTARHNDDSDRLVSRHDRNN